MLLVEPGEGVDERAIDRRVSIGHSIEVIPLKVDLLQIPALVMIVVPGVPDDPVFVAIGKMLLGEPGEGVDEWASDRLGSSGHPAEVDLLQVPALVMIVVPGVPDDPVFVAIGKMLLGEPYESVDERARDRLGSIS